MTQPPQQVAVSAAQITVVDVFAKQIEMGAQLAVITEQLRAIPDHEQRIRALERFRFTVAGLSTIGGIIAGLAGYWVGHVLR